MVVVNVPKLHARKLRVRNLHAIVGILAATVAVPTGCSGEDFEGCEASRTCPPKGGEAGEGTGGESGGGNDTGGNANGGNTNGGNSGSANGGSGNSAGSDDGGAGSGATGGSGDDDTEAPTIVSITPSDGDVDVERDVTVTIEFSEPIDADSVTETSVVLTGPDGDVAGTLGVEDNVVTFTPEKKLYLLGDYELTIDERIADLGGNTLGEGESVGFRVRDGRWGPFVTPFGTAVPRLPTRFARNSSGNIVIAGATSDADTRVWGAVYDVTQDGWTVADDLHGMASFDFYPMYVAIGETGLAVLTWGGHGLDGGGWLGFVPDQGWYAAGAQPFPSYAAVTDRGQAVSVAGGYGPDLVSQTMDIATRSVDEVQQVGLSNRNLYSIVPSLERVAIFTKASDNIVHVTWHDPSLGWGTPQPLATSSGNVFAESDEQGNIVALWLETDNTEIWSRVYDRANEEWTQAMLVTTLQAPGWLGGADMAAGNAIACAGISDTTRLFCAIYQPGVGWLQNSIREVASDFTAFVGPGMTIDQDGNALVVWGNEFRHRRYVKGERWLPTVPGDVQVIPYGSAAAIDGSVTVVGFHTNISDEVFPAVLRFESLTCRRPPRTDSNVPIRFRWNFGKGLPVHAIRSAVWALDSRDDLSPEAPNMREIQVEEVPPCPRAGVPRNMQGYPAR